MKEKVVIAVLSLICIASVACNVYQYNKLNTSRQQLSDTQAQLDGITSSYAELESQLTAMQEELDALNINMADKQSEIDSLAKENSELLSSISELEESIVAVVEDDEEEAEEVDKADKIEMTSTQTTETASIATNQSTATGIDDDILQKMEANGFSFTNGTDGMNIVEVENNGAGRDMTGSSFVGGNWE